MRTNLIRSALFTIFFVCIFSRSHSVIADDRGCMTLELALQEKRWQLPLVEGELTKGAVHDSIMGKNNRGLYQGVYQGADIVVKKVDLVYLGQSLKNAVALNLISEIRFAFELSNMGIAPKFFGVMRFSDGAYGIVTERIYPSWLARRVGHSSNQIPQALRAVNDSVKFKWVEKMNQIVRLISSKKIRAHDLQFLLTPKGEVFVIDFGVYERSDNVDVSVENHANLSTIVSQIH